MMKTISSGKEKILITCLTPTGDRPETLQLTKKWLRSQTVQPDQWLVIDDGKTPISVEDRSGMDYIRREPQAKQEGNTLALNLLAGIPYIKGNFIFFIEDDDWYGPKYIEMIMSQFRNIYSIVGQGKARYYQFLLYL